MPVLSPVAARPRPPQPWNRQLASNAAQLWNLKLGEEAWAVIDAARDYCRKQGRISDTHQLITGVALQLNWSRKHCLAKLYQLFRQEPLERLVVLAGLQGCRPAT